MVRTGFRMVLESQDDLEVVFEAADGIDLAGKVTRDPVDVVLMDIRMPHVDGIAATRDVTALQDPPRVLVLTTVDTDQHILEAIRAGASAFLLKDAEPEQLLAAIRAVHDGDAAVSPRLVARLFDHVGRLPPDVAPVPHLTDSLTPREREVLVHMARGATNPEIATSLTISTATVKTHVGHILAKTGARDRVQAILTAIREGLVDPAKPTP